MQTLYKRHLSQPKDGCYIINRLVVIIETHRAIRPNHQLSPPDSSSVFLFQLAYQVVDLQKKNKIKECVLEETSARWAGLLLFTTVWEKHYYCKFIKAVIIDRNIETIHNLHNFRFIYHLILNCFLFCKKYQILSSVCLWLILDAWQAVSFSLT